MGDGERGGKLIEKNQKKDPNGKKLHAGKEKLREWSEEKNIKNKIPKRREINRFENKVPDFWIKVNRMREWSLKRFHG